MKYKNFNIDANDRCVAVAQYIIENKATVRETAPVFGYSKSTIYNDVTSTLKKRNRALYLQAKEVLDYNKAERHIRGGLATKRKYESEVSREHDESA
ncbi:MAG: Stage III sporulation protein D [Firmicutes bacterium ADurb.Bin193]|nr:MAG: Stage III sporulation protein D [Firmicutes bacterium ADurb.Bin193]